MPAVLVCCDKFWRPTYRSAIFDVVVEILRYGEVFCLVLAQICWLKVFVQSLACSFKIFPPEFPSILCPP